MEQYWYIVKDQKYFGPYYMADIEDLKTHHKLDAQTVLWHPKWPAPQLEFSFNPPPAPKPAIYRPGNSLKTLARIQQHQKSYENMITPTIQLEQTLPFKLKLPMHVNERLGMFLALLLSSILILSVLNNSPLPNRPESMAPSQYKHFENFWGSKSSTTSTDEAASFFTLISKDYKTLWVGLHSNLIIESVTLTALNKNILAKDDFEKTWNQPAGEKLLSLTFENSELPPMGFYQLKISWVESAPWSFDVTKKSAEVSIKIGNHANEQLLGMIKNFHQPAQTENQIAIDSSETEIKEKYQTLSSLVSDIRKNWDGMKELKYSKMVKAMNSFQIKYARSTGSFLSALVLNNEKEIKDLSQGKKAIDTSIIAHLHNLTENAKKTGVLSAELMSNYSLYAKNPQKDALWTQKISTLEKDLLDKINQL